MPATTQSRRLMAAYSSRRFGRMQVTSTTRAPAAGSGAFSTRWTRSTPGTSRRRRCTSSSGASSSASRTTMPETARAFTKSAVPSATTRPRLMITMRSQVLSASLRMWVEKITVLARPASLMMERISTIWLGSRPEVGSSRIRTSGSLSMACANPTRCL